MARKKKNNSPTASKSAGKRAASSRLKVGKQRAFLVVGIGASAGGLDAIKRLFEAMPAEPDMALVVVQHLDPAKNSLAAEMIARYTRMPVHQVQGDSHVLPNRVYVIPPGKYLSMVRGELHLSELDQRRGLRMAIDVFLLSLAKDETHSAAAVILSGTGTDGTVGIKAIRSAGGLVIVQDPTTAEHTGMPSSAIASGAANYILPPEKIPEELMRYSKQPYLSKPTETARDADDESVAASCFNEILALLRTHGKHDFRNYKQQSLIRRTRRRMSQLHLNQYEPYLNYLRQHPEEIAALSRDLLITVTEFFRDPDAWEQLRRLAIVPLVEKARGSALRVWIPGCATGEESYSVAIQILEELQRTGKNCPLQIFASDVEKSVIEFARIGRYNKNIEADVSPERIRRFFIASADDSYQVTKAVRDAVVFAEQNLLSDAPFSSLDLICCRNLLIYLNPEVQRKVIALFHFALRPGGTLFLGSAESLADQTDLFQTLHKRWRIFRRVGPTRYDRVNIPLIASGRGQPLDSIVAPARREAQLFQIAQRQLLHQLAPSAVLIDRNWRILFICGDIDPYVAHKKGVPTDNLLDNVRRGLRTGLRGAVHEALAGNRTVSVTARRQSASAHPLVSITVSVIRERELEDVLLLVLFDEQENQPRSPEPASAAAAPAFNAASESSSDAIILQLEEELAHLKDDLQATIEQLDVANEKYRAANEESMTVNEELQSTNEELETSKEELQSLNEELSTINSQLAGKVDELETKHADLENLIAVTNLPTVCLDTDLAVRWFTPAIEQVIRLKPADRGRKLADLAHDFVDGDPSPLARRVLAELVGITDEVATHDGRTYLRRAIPYRADDHRIGGVVITLVDITQRKQDEQVLREAKEFSDKIIDTVREALLVLDADLRVVRANAQFYRLFHVSPAETEGRLIFQLGDNQWDIPDLRQMLESMLSSQRTFTDFEVQHDFMVIGRRVMLLNARQVSHHRQILLAIEDVSDRRRAEEALRGLNSQLELRVAERTQDVRRLATLVESAHDAIYTRTLEGTIRTWNAGAEQLYGYTAEEAVGQSFRMLLPTGYEIDLEDSQSRLLRGEPVPPFETVRRRKNGDIAAVSVALSPIKDAAGQMIGIGSIARCITELSRNERNSQFLNRLHPMLLQTRDSDRLIGETLRAIGEYLQVDHCTYFELTPDASIAIVRHEYRDSRPSVLGTHRVADFSEPAREAMAAGQELVVSNVATDPRTATGVEQFQRYEIAALVLVPLTTAAGAKACLAVNSRLARGWRTDEVQLLRDVAARLFPAIERAYAEQALREREEQFRRLNQQLNLVTDAMSAPVTRCSRDFRYLWVSAPYAAWLGVSAEEIVGRPIVDVVGRETFDKIMPHLEKVLAGEEVRYEEEINFPGIGRRWVSATYTPTFDLTGVPDGWVAVVIDIDNRKRAEQSLAQRAAQQAAVAALGQTALVERELPIFFDECLRTAATVLGTEFCMIWELLPGDRALLLRAGVGWGQGVVGHATVSAGADSQAGYTLLSGGSVTASDLRTETRFGTPPLLVEHGIVSGISCLVGGPEQRPYGILCTHSTRRREFTAEDIHFLESVANLLGGAIQRKHFEEGLRSKSDEVRTTTQQLWQAAKLASVGELAASIAHELNNPLATVSLRLESLLGRTPDNDPRRHSIQIVEQETKRMANLVANLLQFSHRGKELASKVDTRHELIHAIELVYHYLSRREIKIVQELADNTPLIYADSQKLRQVFLNLFTNAGDAMPNGGILTLRTEPDTLMNGTAAVRIEFADTGDGIPPEHMEMVFDPFFTTKEEGHGTGLGLAICRRVIEEHHGTICIHSKVGSGTTVRIVLPVADEGSGPE